MIIRSQDKKSITTDLNLEILKPYNIKSGSWDIISNTSGTIAFIPPKVFQMPQDSEV